MAYSVGADRFLRDYNQTGVIHRQDWEFYATTLSLFVVFELPGFIYHYDLKRILSGKKEMHTSRGYVCGFYGNAILFESKAQKQAHSEL